MKNLKKITVISFLLLVACFSNAQEKPISKASFDDINLTYPGLEKVNQLVMANKYQTAAIELLRYYRERQDIKHPGYNFGDEVKYATKPLNKVDQEIADNALLHKFKPVKNYAFYDYGTDINWQLLPRPDVEMQFQLHRLHWWDQMGLAYWATGDEKYAKEWIFQFKDWIKKNPQGLSAINDKYAWRPMEVGLRMGHFVQMLSFFGKSPNFTPAFLLEYLKNIHGHASYLINHYTKDGNHLLFEAETMIYAGGFFPELKGASDWRKSGVTVLNTEIKKQTLSDGMNWELSPLYHLSNIDIFLNSLRGAQLFGIGNEFPQEYKDLVEKMILALANYSFPDYSYPDFGDSWHYSFNREKLMKNYTKWTSVFPKNQVFKYFATDGAEGTAPTYLSKALTSAGFYTFRSGWKMDATVAVLKASQPGEFHAQPDNGTFELWVKGRNFMPDTGSYTYGGTPETNAKRDWYRQSRVHQTLTLENKNMVITKATQNKLEFGDKLDILTYTNPSYANLNHKRSVLFIDKKYFLIIDQAIGTATGNLGIHFQLKEDSKPVFDKAQNKITTTYADGNNLLVQYLNKDAVLSEEEGKVSYGIDLSVPRPAFVFEKQKTNTKAQQFITVLYPFTGNKAPQIKLVENKGNDYEKGNINLSIIIDGKKSELKTSLNN